jgi:hypothetical protein
VTEGPLLAGPDFRILAVSRIRTRRKRQLVAFKSEDLGYLDKKNGFIPLVARGMVSSVIFLWTNDHH